MKLIFTLTFLLLASFAQAATRYASPTGAGTTCSNATPCSLTTGLTQIVASDTLILKNGVYTTLIVPSTVMVPSGSAGNPTIIQAETARQAILRPSAPDANGIILWAGYGSHDITYDGISVDGQSVSNTDNIIYISANGSTRSSNIIFRNGECTRSRSTSCISVAGVNNQILNNLIHDNGPNTQDVGIHGIYVTSPGSSLPSDGIIIDGNTIFNGTAAAGSTSLGIQLFHDTINNTIIRNNIIHHVQDTGIYLSGGDNNRAYSNIVYSSGSGLIVGSFVSNNSIASNQVAYNNTFSANARCGYQEGNPGGTNVWKNNLCLSNTLNTLDNVGGGVMQGSCSVQNNMCSMTNALVVSAATGNFTPAPGSALIDAGTPSITGTIILQKCPAGSPCFNGANPDVGAVESGTVVGAPTITITSHPNPVTVSISPINLSGTSTP